VHGSAEVGVAGGNHVSGNYQSGVVHVTKAFGSCDAPTAASVFRSESPSKTSTTRTVGTTSVGSDGHRTKGVTVPILFIHRGPNRVTARAASPLLPSPASPWRNRPLPAPRP
jgi:hypothetical protein